MQLGMIQSTLLYAVGALISILLDNNIICQDMGTFKGLQPILGTSEVQFKSL